MDTMQTDMYKLVRLILVSMIGVFVPLVTFAVEGDPTPVNVSYRLMAPLGGVLDGSVNLTDYLRGVVQFAIGIAGVLAVIMVVVCGIKLMGTPSSSGRSEAKECIWNAIFGVLLAIAAWVILYTVNPLLLSNELRLGDVSAVPTAVGAPTNVVAPRPTVPGYYFRFRDEANNVVNSGPFPSMDQCKIVANAQNSTYAGSVVEECFPIIASPISSDEQGARTRLCGPETYEKNKCIMATPIGVNKPPCPNRGITNCTDLKGIPLETIDFIRSLSSTCNCDVLITGGTEAGHATHEVNKPIFDLRLSPGDRLWNLITNASEKKTSFKGNPKWRYGEYVFTDELSSQVRHWHVCKQGARSTIECQW